MPSYTFHLFESPIEEERPRTGKNGAMYSPSKPERVRVRKKLKSILDRKYPSFTLPGKRVPLEVTLIFSTKRKWCRAAGELDVDCPDIDNLEKFYLDAMNEIVYHDDKQVCRVVKVKMAIPDSASFNESVSITVATIQVSEPEDVEEDGFIQPLSEDENE